MDEMTTAELNQYLENIAKLIETTAEDAASAAQIVRDSMASEEDTEELDEMTGKEIARLMEWLKAQWIHRTRSSPASSTPYLR